VSARFRKAIIYPIHPRTRKRLKEFGIAAGGGIKLIDPVDYLAFLRLESQADLILTDSGGVQEEACILGVPCVTLRENTERPETLDVGANALAGTDPGRIMEKAEEMLAKRGRWRNPFGDGKAAERIVGIVAGTPSA
jgi:UDP-N-acetylglucosamine 2-epimerase (non-hydrolysing)